MPKLIEDFLKETMQGNRNRIALRIPPELEELLQTKAKESGYKTEEFAAFIRDNLAMLVLPEILKSDLIKTNSIWFLNEGEKALEFNIAKPVAKLKKIKKLAQYGIESYEKFFADMTQKEVEMKITCLKKFRMN